MINQHHHHPLHHRTDPEHQPRNCQFPTPFRIICPSASIKRPANTGNHRPKPLRTNQHITTTPTLANTPFPQPTHFLTSYAPLTRTAAHQPARILSLPHHRHMKNERSRAQHNAHSPNRKRPQHASPTAYARIHSLLSPLLTPHTTSKLRSPLTRNTYTPHSERSQSIHNPRDTPPLHARTLANTPKSYTLSPFTPSRTQHRSSTRPVALSFPSSKPNYAVRNLSSSAGNRSKKFLDTEKNFPSARDHHPYILAHIPAVIYTHRNRAVYHTRTHATPQNNQT